VLRENCALPLSCYLTPFQSYSFNPWRADSRAVHLFESWRIVGTCILAHSTIDDRVYIRRNRRILAL
jgi:hypothetical protein